jgi:crotonobetainyl-CoA:carnitine CoA-transferase CaiB-like acyl-CoA transferase
MLLADFGAEVIKIESTSGGDPVRMFPPFLDNMESSYYFAFNRNKKSLSIDLRQEQGKEIIFKLCQKADVLVESFRPGVPKQMGIDFETINQLNERLVYCSITGYGQDSSMGAQPGHDINFLSLSGVLDLCGLGDRPVLPGIQVGDIGGGSFPAFSTILLALMVQEKTGKGQYIDCSITDSLFFYMPVIMAENWGLNEPPKRGEFVLSGNYANYGIYETMDNKFISLGAVEEKFWRRFVERLGHPEWGDDYFDMIRDRDYRKKVAEIITTKTRDEWVKIYEGSNCCLTPVYSLPEAEKFMDKRRMITKIEGQKVISNPLKLSNYTNVERKPAPSLGQDTGPLLADLLDYTKEEITKLKEEGTIFYP